MAVPPGQDVEALKRLLHDNGIRIPDEIKDTTEEQATAVQAMSEGLDLPRTANGVAKVVTFEGEKFAIADRVGLMPLMEFAYHANSGLDTSDMEALAAIYEMLKDCIRPDEWDRFRAHAKKTKADAETLMPVVQQTVELLTARPTGQESGSLRPSQRTSDSLKDSSSGLTPVEHLGKVV